MKTKEITKLDLLLSLRLSEATRLAGPSKKVMREIGRKAQDRGLTAEVLESIFDEQ